MSSPLGRAGRLRGALVGVCAAGSSAVAHGVGGGELPSGGSLALFLVACATVGAASSSIHVGGRARHLLYLCAALAAGQTFGHLALTVAAQTHIHCLPTVSPQMMLAHGAAAAVCALLIGVVERLYVVCASVLCWLRIVAVSTDSPTAVAVRWPTKTLVAQCIVLSTRGPRAPPRLMCA